MNKTTKTRRVLSGAIVFLSVCLYFFFFSGQIERTFAATINCDGCSDCSSKIQNASPGDIVILTTNINNHDDTCIDFGGSVNGITFDGNDHLISGDDDFTGHGIRLYTNSNNNTIKNCEISRFNSGIYVFSTFNNTFQNINAHSNRSSGIEIFYSSSNTVSDSILQENRYYDFYFVPNPITDCSNTLINVTGSGDRPIGLYNSSVTLVDQEFSALYLCNADNSTLDNVTIKGSNTLNNNGFRLFYTDNSSLNDITSSNNSEGINFSDSTSNNLQNIQCDSNHDQGIMLDGSSNNTMNNVQTNSNSQCGMYIMHSSSNSLNNITSSYNSFAGIYFDRSSSNSLENAILDSNDLGINTKESLSVTIEDSYIINSGLYGINLNSSETYLTYNNYFNNSTNINFSGTTYANTWSTAVTAGTNIVNGPYLGGNYWAKPNGTGFSQNCDDINLDGFCDNSFVLNANNVDLLPLTIVLSPTHTISGTLNYYDGVKTISNATVILEDDLGNQLDVTTTNSSGYYEFTGLADGNDYVVRIEKEDNIVANGVNVLDLTSIVNHIIMAEPEPLDSIFKKISADVNEDELINVLDLTNIVNYIIGSSSALPSGNWKFYSSDIIPTEENYLSEETERTYTNLSGNMTGEDFVGIKMGDVNDSWID